MECSEHAKEAAARLGGKLEYEGTLKTKNTFKIEELHAGKWWVASPDHWNYQAAAKAVQSVFGVKPDLTREGGSIPVTLTFQDYLGKNVLLLPMGKGMACKLRFLKVGDDGAHSTNEKLDLSNYISGEHLKINNINFRD